MATMKADLSTGSIGKWMVKLAVPSIVAQLINALYNVVDRIYIGHMGADGSLALTGVGLCFPILMVISAFSAFVGMGGGPRASIAMGQKNMEGAERILSNCFTLLLGISIVLTAVLLPLREPLLLSFGASQDTLPYAESYLAIYLCGTVFVQMSLGMNTFITVQGRATISMLTVLIGAVINIGLDPLFIYTFGMGSTGSCVGNRHFPGRFLCMGAADPFWPPFVAAYPSGILAAAVENIGTGYGVGAFPVYYAGYRKCHQCGL